MRCFQWLNFWGFDIRITLPEGIIILGIVVALCLGSKADMCDILSYVICSAWEYIGKLFDNVF